MPVTPRIIKDKLYYYFAVKNWGVRREYENYVDSHREEHLKAPWKDWIVLIRLNFHYRIMRKTNYMLFHNESYNLIYPESEAVNREDIDSLVKQLSQYDIVSFDIFDTLLFRPFSKPTDIFYLLQAQNGLFDFSRNRQLAEHNARQKTVKPKMEIDIFDIYKELANYYNIKDYNKMAFEEIKLETDLCYANEYMYEVYSGLIKAGVKVIATSDMYLPSKYVRKILNKCGYNGIEKIYMSCEYGACKTDGSLQEIVQNKYGDSIKIVHVDDSIRCIEGCKQKGWDTIHYPQCNEVGNPYRLWYLNTPISLMYKGIINNHIHCGLYKHSTLSEFGYIYAGILSCGYAEWLNEFSKKNNFDKILFLARDTDIFYKIYKKYYGDVDCEYVNSSRSALQQLAFGKYPQEFINGTINTRIGLGKSLKTVMDECDISVIQNYLGDYGLEEDNILTNKNIDDFTKLIYAHCQEIEEYFDKNDDVAKEYFKTAIGNAKKVCIAGFGWTGTEIVFLKYLIQEKWNLDIEIMGTLMGSKTDPKSSALISSGVITPYMFSANQNTNFNLDVSGLPEEVIVLGLEAVFSSTQPSLIKYGNNSGSTEKNQFVTKKNNPNAELIEEIQEGILKFAADFHRHRDAFKKYLPIKAVEAYEPIYRIYSNHPYIAFTLGNTQEMPRAISGNCNDKQYMTFVDLMKKYGLNTELPYNTNNKATKTESNEYIKSRIDYQNKSDVLKSIIKKIGNEHDDIYIYKHHIGEIYIYLNLLDYYVKHNKSKKPAIIVNEYRYISLYKMFLKEIDLIYVPLSPEVIDKTFEEDITYYKNHRFFCPTPDRFEDLRKAIFHSPKDAHFYEYIKYSMNISPYEDIHFKKPTISKDVRESVIEKAEEIGLNLRKFVVFFPEAVTASKLSMRFWKLAYQLFVQNGYDVFVNARSDEYDEVCTKKCEMDIAEIYYLSSRSEGVVALVNGLVVSFALMDVPRYIIYTRQTPTVGDRMDASKMLKSYRMDALPDAEVDNLYEINMDITTEDQILKKICRDYNIHFKDKSNTNIVRRRPNANS